MLKHDCHRCCLNRRECLQFLSASAIGAGLAASGLTAWAAGKSGPAPSDFIDPASLRPKPKVRVAATFLEMPRPYWLGWPGTTYDLDEHQKEYRTLLEQSAGQDGRRGGAGTEPDQRRGRRDGVDQEDRCRIAGRHSGDAPAHGVLELGDEDRPGDRRPRCWSLPRSARRSPVTLIRHRARPTCT